MTIPVSAPATLVDEARRSVFVTVLAWVLIVCSGFETFISLMQAIGLIFLSPNQFWSGQPAQGIEKLPPLMRFMFSHVQYWFVAFWLLSAFTLVSSVFLLRRKNWARFAIIAILTLGIVSSVGSLDLQFALFSGMPNSAASEQTQSMFIVMRFAAALFEIAVAVIFAWLIWRLLSPAIKGEFRAP